MNTIENHYLNNINVCERNCWLNRKYSEALKKVCECKDKLLQALSPEAKKLFEEYSETHLVLDNVNEIDMFCIGFRPGVKLITDVYTTVDGVIVENNQD